jgi:integrase/recombinase XerD
LFYHFINFFLWKHSKPKTINTKLNALVKFNEFLIESNVQEEMVLTKKDYVKVQQQFASLAKIKLTDVEKFRQLILDRGSTSEAVTTRNKEYNC